MSTVLFDAIKTQSKVTDSVIVAFSGGKESVVTLDLCFKYFKHVYPYWLYVTKPYLSFQEKTLQWYENKYEVEITRLPHFTLSEYFHYGSFRGGNLKFPLYGINEVYEYMRYKTGCGWIAAGERISDSLIRRAMIKHSSSIDVQRGRFYPVAYWNKDDIIKYIKFHKLYLGWDNKTFGHSFALFEGKDMSILKHARPKDYDIILNLYPFSDATAQRYEMYGIAKQRGNANIKKGDL